MKKKLLINNLKINSFITSIEDQDKKTIFGQYEVGDLLTNKRGRICQLVRIAKAFKSRPNPECFPTFDIKDKDCMKKFQDAYYKSDIPPCFPRN